MSLPPPRENPVSASDDTHLKSNTFAHFCGPRVFTRDISNIFPQLYIWSILYMLNSKKDAQEASGGRRRKKRRRKNYKLKVWHRFQIQNFSTFKYGRLTCRVKKKFIKVKKIQIRLFTKKNVVKQENMSKGHISWRRKKNANGKNLNWMCGIHIELPGSKKAFFSISYFEKWLYMQSLPICKLRPNLTQFLYTLMHNHMYVQLYLCPILCMSNSIYAQLGEIYIWSTRLFVLYKPNPLHTQKLRPRGGMRSSSSKIRPWHLGSRWFGNFSCMFGRKPNAKKNADLRGVFFFFFFLC